MKVTAQQRGLNIIQNAIDNGLEIDFDLEFENIVNEAEEFLLQNTEPKLEEGDVSFHRNGQNVQWCDGLGYCYEGDGDYICSRQDWYLPAETKLALANVCDSEGQHVQIFTFLGENEFNVPYGYSYSKKEGHVKKEEE
jgi:hypothetical protein